GRVDAGAELVGHGPVGSRLELRVSDATKLGEADASFDWVWCGDVLHHIQDTGRALSEFARVVRPGGRIVVKKSHLLHGPFPRGRSAPRGAPAPGGDGVEPLRGGRVLLRGAPPAHPRVVSDGRPGRGELPHVPAGAPGAASPRRARLHPARRLRAQLGSAPARAPDLRRLDATLGPVRGRVSDLRPGRPRLLLSLPHQRARRPALTSATPKSQTERLSFRQSAPQPPFEYRTAVGKWLARGEALDGHGGPEVATHPWWEGIWLRGGASFSPPGSHPRLA